MIEDPSQHTILVSGATGQQGGAVARHLLKHGFRVRAFTRTPDQKAALALSKQGAKIAEGSFDDRASLGRALDGVYGAYSVQTFSEEGVEGEIRQGQAFADAAKDAGVEHFVYSSVGGAERDTGIPHFDSKWNVEEHIRKIGLPATILRPVFFMQNWAVFSRKSILEDGKILQPLSPDTPLQQIAVDDIGAFAAIAFLDPEKWKGKAIELAGDELTMTETAETLSYVAGNPVEYVQVPWKDFEDQAGEEMAVMYRWFEEKGYQADISALKKTYPELHQLEPFLRNQNWIKGA